MIIGVSVSFIIIIINIIIIIKHRIFPFPGQNPEIHYPTIYKIMVFYWIILGLVFLATIIQEISDAISSRVDKIESDSTSEEAETTKEPSVSIQDGTNVSIQDDTKSLIRNTSIQDDLTKSLMTYADGGSQNGTYGPRIQISNKTKELEDSRL